MPEPTPWWKRIAIMSAGLAFGVPLLMMEQSPLRGWVLILGFGACGVAFASGIGTAATPLRQNMALGAYFMVIGVNFGLRDVLGAPHRRLETAVLGVLIATVLWVVFEQVRFRFRPPVA